MYNKYVDQLREIQTVPFEFHLTSQVKLTIMSDYPNSRGDTVSWNLFVRSSLNFTVTSDIATVSYEIHAESEHLRVCQTSSII